MGGLAWDIGRKGDVADDTGAEAEAAGRAEQARLAAAAEAEAAQLDVDDAEILAHHAITHKHVVLRESRAR